MTSSMMAGERRWVSARRGGMTVLGKVAVPKPLNLPSQRLENHGLDPNVEIVPKGSLSWGSRSSSSASNPWGSSALSPNADGATGSPSHLSGRPSSGGSGTRPSTAGSDRMHEPAATAWGPNSRPSSASGALTSNQTSQPLSRPRSAETRPSSSQLSRFAEPAFDNSVAWGPNGAAEKMVLGSKTNDFSLNSGDFPTLGTERDNFGKGTESQDHGSDVRPISGSGRVAQAKERTHTSQADVKSGTVNTWTRDGTQHAEDAAHPSAEKWQGDPQQYLNPNVPPQHFDAWRGPPMNASAGVWYRGPPGGPPYPPVAHGGFPMEPFPYYHPQIPPPALANSQPVPPPGAGPRAHHPNSGDFYRPQMPDAFIRPGMPIRPGFYPGPMPYDGYYGPPMGYNPNERDVPFMGMPAGPPGGPPVYNMYRAPNPSEPNDNHARAGGRGSTGKMLVSEQLDSGRSEDTRGPYKVLMKQQNEWDAEEGENGWESTGAANTLSLEKGDESRTAAHKNEWGADNRRNEEMHSRRKVFGENSSSGILSSSAHSSDSVKVKSPESFGGSKAVDDSWGKKSEIATSAFSQVPHVLPAKPKDPTLIQKIEGLNAKVRASDGREDVASISIKEEHKVKLQVINSKANSNSRNEVGSTHTTSNFVRSSHEVGVSTGDNTVQSTAENAQPFSRRAYHGVQGRTDHHSKGRLNNQDSDGWRRKHPPPVSGASDAVSTANVDHASSYHISDHCISMETAEKSEVQNEGESFTLMFDATDGHAQRAKMRELAKQRAIQLQKEEEERIREQKAKALAKLEELNRRMLAVDGSTQKLEKALHSGTTQQDLEESQILPDPVMDASIHEAPSSVLDSDPHILAQTIGSSMSGVGESSALSRGSYLEASKNTQQERLHGQSLLSKVDSDNFVAEDSKADHLVNDNGLPRQKRMAHKQKQSIQVEKSSSDKSTPFSTSEALKVHNGAVLHDNATAEVVPAEVFTSPASSVSNNSHVVPELSGHQRRKNNRSSKNKHKLEDASMPASASPVQTETHPAVAPTEGGKMNQLDLDSTSVQLVADIKDAIQPDLGQNSSLPSEEVHGRVNNQWKPQHSRRMPRNPQGGRTADRFHVSDAVVWAPVRSQNKVEPEDEASQRTGHDAVPPVAKSNNLMQSTMKNKRAEMERYVAKPAAKELAQQGSVPQSVASSPPWKTALDETSEKEESGSHRAIPAITNVGPVESKNGESKQNKQTKVHGAWRQRGSVESQRGQGFQHGSSSTLNSSRNAHQSMDQHEASKPEPDAYSVPIETKISHEWDPSDGWHIPEYPSEIAPVLSVVKDQGGVTSKGRRHTSKGQRSTSTNHDPDRKNVIGGEPDKGYTQSAALESSQTDRAVSSKENRAALWQPKSQAYSSNNQRGIRSGGGQNVISEVKKDSPPRGRQHLSPQRKISDVTPKLQPEELVSGNKNVREALNAGHHEAKRERRSVSSKGRPRSPNQGLSYMEEQAPPEQHLSSGYHKNGSQNNRLGRGNEIRGDSSSGGQEIRQQHLHTNKDRQRQNSHYEYQPVGSNNNNSKFSNIDGPSDGSRSRYRERGSGQHRRGGGNFYGRQTGSVRVEAGYD